MCGVSKQVDVMIQTKIFYDSGDDMHDEDFTDRINEFCERHAVRSVTYHMGNDTFHSCVFVVYEKQL